MKLFKILLISLFLAYPFLSMADITIVACNQNIKIDSKIGICLPSTVSGRFSTDLSLWNSFIYGKGNSFSEAWDDAQVACKSMITIIDQNDKYVLEQQAEKSICDLQECIVLEEIRMDTIAGDCFCHQTGYSSKVQKADFDCNEKASGPVSVLGKVNFKELYDSGQEICRQEAITQKKSFSTYCLWHPFK